MGGTSSSATLNVATGPVRLLSIVWNVAPSFAAVTVFPASWSLYAPAMNNEAASGSKYTTARISCSPHRPRIHLRFEGVRFD